MADSEETETDADTHTWVEDPKLLTKIMTTKPGRAFDSDIFVIDDLQWQIRLYPNGYNQSQIGSFLVSLKLVTLPSKWKKNYTYKITVK